MPTTNKRNPRTAERQIIPARSPEHAETMDADLKRLIIEYFEMRKRLSAIDAKIAASEAVIYRELAKQ